ncbi:MAG: hypothetical protein SV760_00950, partial [Halobacteria archaeon]|nr:hypothetical protein [Halobacteria archaeon]
LDGVALPSTIEDSRGKIPIVLPDSDPSKRYRGNTVEGILEAIRSESLTGYVVTEDDDVYLARNGNLVKYYVDGEFGTDTDEIGRAPRTATLFELSHNFLNDVDSLTPSEYEGRVAEESDEGKFESIAGNIGDTSESAETSDEEDNVIQVGGDEVNIDEMFQKADEILEELE